MRRITKIRIEKEKGKKKESFILPSFLPSTAADFFDLKENPKVSKFIVESTCDGGPAQGSIVQWASLFRFILANTAF